MKLTFTYCFVLLLTFTTNAQWISNTSTNLALASVTVSDMQSITTTDGKTWIAFYNNNNGNYDMRAQLLDVNGNKLLGTDGVLVCNQTSGSATYVFNVCLDENNNLIIGFQYDAGGTTNAVIAKVTTTGTLPWGATGVVVGSGLSPYPTVLSSGEIVVTWNNSVNNTLSIQKFSAAGVAGWAAPIDVLVGTSKTTRGQLIANSFGNCTLVFQKKGFGISTTLYAQRYSSEGLAVWSAPIQICNQTTSGARYYSIKAEADTTYFGYYSSAGSRFNSFLQRINPNGVLPYGINGVAFDDNQASTDNYQTTTNIALTPGSNFIWAMCTYCNTSQSQYGIYTQKFLKSTGVKQLGTTGKQVYAISTNSDQQTGSVALYNDAPIFMHYDVNYKIYASCLDANGSFVWTGNRVELSTTTATLALGKGRYNFSYMNGQGVGVWYEDRGTGIGYMGYAQNITSSGTTGPTLPVILSSFKGNRNGKSTELFWTSETEINSAGYHIERSIDGINFSSLQFIISKAVNGNSNSTINYAAIDQQPLSGNNYYRLKQTDKDGKFKYSNTIVINFNSTIAYDFEIIYPNPVKKVLNINLNAISSNKITLLVSTMDGKIVVKEFVNVAIGKNNIIMNVANLSHGNYIIQGVSETGKTKAIQFTKD